jgi:hypothetical protein
MEVQAVVGQAHPKGCQAACRKGMSKGITAAVGHACPKAAQEDIGQTHLGSTACCKTDLFKAEDAGVEQTRSEVYAVPGQVFPGYVCPAAAIEHKQL